MEIAKHYKEHEALGFPTTETSPAGSDKQIQFNDNGVFGGNSGLLYDLSTNTVINQVFQAAAIGSSVVTNGDFATGALSPWTGTGWSVINDATYGYIAKHTSGTARLGQTCLTPGLLYRITYTVVTPTGVTLTGNVRPYVGNVAGTLRTAAGTYTENITAGSGSKIEFAPSTTFNGAIENVSVQLLTGATPVWSVKNVAGDTGFEFRISETPVFGEKNWFFGVNAGEYAVLNGNVYSNIVFADNALKLVDFARYGIVIGQQAAQKATTFDLSFAIGPYALQNANYVSNVGAIGYFALNNVASVQNTVAIGTSAGGFSSAANDSVFIGYRAGEFNARNSVLYIANNGSTPLIYGEFDTPLVSLNGSVNLGASQAERVNFIAGYGATAPTNTTTPAGWVDVNVNGTAYKLPIYQ